MGRSTSACHRNCHPRGATACNCLRRSATTLEVGGAGKRLKTLAMPTIGHGNCQSRGRGFKSRRARQSIKR
jgi:hypothetical protein